MRAYGHPRINLAINTLNSIYILHAAICHKPFIILKLRSKSPSVRLLCFCAALKALALRVVATYVCLFNLPVYPLGLLISAAFLPVSAVIASNELVMLNFSFRPFPFKFIAYIGFF
jgi:hypothetical protein